MVEQTLALKLQHLQPKMKLGLPDYRQGPKKQELASDQDGGHLFGSYGGE